jgi:hypothetical protein
MRRLLSGNVVFADFLRAAMMDFSDHELNSNVCGVVLTSIRC